MQGAECGGFSFFGTANQSLISIVWIRTAPVEHRRCKKNMAIMELEHSQDLLINRSKREQQQIIIIINNNFTLATTQGICVPYTAKQSCWSSANHSGSASEWKEFPHQSQSKGSLTHYRFKASSTDKYISTKRLLLLIHVTNFARYCILWLQICPVSGRPLSALDLLLDPHRSCIGK